MGKKKGSIAQPGTTKVPVQGGVQHVELRPWTMAQRAEFRPRIEDLINKIMEIQGGEFKNFDLGVMFLHVEEELAIIAQSSAILPPGLKWDDLWWEDLPNIIQGVWDTSVVREGGGGIGGKALSLLSAITLQVLQTPDAASASQTDQGVPVLTPVDGPSSQPTPRKSNSRGSPSSHGGGAVAPNTSEPL